MKPGPSHLTTSTPARVDPHSVDYPELFSGIQDWYLGLPPNG